MKEFALISGMAIVRDEVFLCYFLAIIGRRILIERPSYRSVSLVNLPLTGPTSRGQQVSDFFSTETLHS